VHRPADAEAEAPQKVAQAVTPEAVAAGQAESGRGDRQPADLPGTADRLAELERSVGERAVPVERSAQQQADLRGSAELLEELATVDQRPAGAGRSEGQIAERSTERMVAPDLTRKADSSQTEDQSRRTEELAQSARQLADRERPGGVQAEPKAKPTVLASSDDPDAKLPGDPEPPRSRPHDRRVSAKAAEAAGATGNAGVSGYQVEAAELLAGAAARRKRRTTTASGLPAPDPATQEPPIKLTRPLRPGVTRPAAQD
jgi:hypothetical protein